MFTGKNLTLPAFDDIAPQDAVAVQPATDTPKSTASSSQTAASPTVAGSASKTAVSAFEASDPDLSYIPSTPSTTSPRVTPDTIVAPAVLENPSQAVAPVMSPASPQLGLLDLVHMIQDNAKSPVASSSTPIHHVAPQAAGAQAAAIPVAAAQAAYQLSSSAQAMLNRLLERAQQNTPSPVAALVAHTETSPSTPASAPVETTTAKAKKVRASTPVAGSPQRVDDIVMVAESNYVAVALNANASSSLFRFRHVKITTNMNEQAASSPAMSPSK